LVLLASFVFAGRGLGASGAFASTAAGLVRHLSPAVATNGYFSRYLEGGGNPWQDWLVLELLGVCVGGWLSAALAHRVRWTTERGADVTTASRLLAAALGGGAMGVGAVLARGCTSGQALTGGALLSVGSWLFVIAAFASAYAVSPFIRRFWQ
jgi:hypothetical protein